MKALVTIITLVVLAIMAHAGDPLNHTENLIKVHVGLIEEVCDAIK